jgi:hypothetical protein
LRIEHALVVARFVAFISNEIEHLLDRALNGDLAFYACHGNSRALPPMLVLIRQDLVSGPVLPQRTLSKRVGAGDFRSA